MTGTNRNSRRLFHAMRSQAALPAAGRLQAGEGQNRWGPAKRHQAAQVASGHPQATASDLAAGGQTPVPAMEIVNISRSRST